MYYRDMKNTPMTLEKLLNRVPKFMHPELDRVENLADLEFQIAHEIDLVDDGTVKWTKAQLHRAKIFYADVHLAAEAFRLEYPELVDDLNHADGSYTEGPWKYTTNVGPTKALIVESDGGSTVVEVSNRTHDSRFLTHVRLMTAAPELLEQLKLARKCIAWCRAHHKDIQSNSGGLPVETLMDAVIARAEGR